MDLEGEGLKTGDSEQKSDNEDVLNVSGASNPPSGKPDKMLGTSDFVELLGQEVSYYIDKTKLVQAFFECKRRWVLVTAPRRFGKTINLAMLRHFFELQVNVGKDTKLSDENFQEKVKETKNYKLFHQHNLIITTNDMLMKKHFGKYPVLSISFKCGVKIISYMDAIAACLNSIRAAFQDHIELASSDTLNAYEKIKYAKWCNGEWDITNKNDQHQILEGLQTLAEFMFKHFGRKIILLVDEYDAVITSAMLRIRDKEELNDVIQNCTSIVTETVKENPGENWVAYAFITGISHITGMGLSGSNVKPFKFLGGHLFVPFYGLTHDEMKGLFEDTYKLSEEKLEDAKKRFNGYRSKCGIEMYNIWSGLEYASKKHERRDTYEWQDTGMIVEAFKFPTIKEMIETKLLRNKPVKIGELKKSMTVDDVFELIRIIAKFDPSNVSYPQSDIFFSFMLEQGYLSYAKNKSEQVMGNDWVVIPNDQLKDEIREKLETFDITIFGQDKRCIEKCRCIIQKLSQTECDEEVFKLFRENLENVYKSYAAVWITNTEENMRCTMSILVDGLGFEVNAETHFSYVLPDGKRQKRFIDYMVVKDNAVLLMEFKYDKSSEAAMDAIKSREYYNVMEATDIFTSTVTHYVLLGINMAKNGNITIGYLQNSQDFNDVTYLP